jgi:hypothetical protein
MKTFIMFFSVFFLVMGMANANPKLLLVDWPFAKKAKSLTVLSVRSVSYPEKMVEKANSVHLPVYMPSAYVYQTNLQLVGDGDFYTATIPLQQATMFIMGDRTYQQEQNSTTDSTVSIRTKELSFVRAEGMVSVDFNRHGANYTLSIECAQYEDDQRCVQTNFLQQVYRDLVMIGGQP